MTKFQEQIGQAFTRPPDERPREAHWSRATVEEFAQWVNEESGGLVYARIEETGVPESTRLVWGPVTLLGVTSTLLVVSSQAQGERAVREGYPRLLSREELQADILRLVASEEFKASLKEIMRRAREEPVDGFLRSGYPRDRNPSNDVLIEVPPDVQKRLADAYLSKEARPEVRGVFVRLPGPSPIAKGRFEDRKDTLRWLVSGGVVLNLTLPIEVRPGGVELSGVIERQA
jgi:hypothetical protein